MGTTGLLLAFAASLLILVGTLFAFDAWPGADIRDAVDSMLVDEDGDPVRKLAGPEQVAADASPAALAVAANPTGSAAPGSGTTGGDLGGAGGTGGGGGTGVPGGSLDGGTGGGGGGGGVTVPGGGGPSVPTPSVDTSQPTNNLADGTEQITNNVGNTVGQVNPNLGNTVTETGQNLSDIVRDLPDVEVGGGGVKVGNLQIGD